jgi:hypothetical protein
VAEVNTEDFWKFFMETGNIDFYLMYKTYEAHGREKPEKRKKSKNGAPRGDDPTG